MGKRSGLLILVALFLLCRVWATMSIDSKAEPTAIDLEWEEVKDSAFYDIYLDDVFVDRLDSSKHSYKLDKLKSDTAYEVAIAARDESNNTLDAAFIDQKTTNWDGLYTWVNKTGDDNNGKLKELTLRVQTVHDEKYGQYYEIYLVPDDGRAEFKVFPLFSFTDSAINEWHKFKENSVAGNSYRENSIMFNTSSFTPGKWKVSKIVIDSDFIEAYIQTSVLNMTLITVTTYRFVLKDGIKRLLLDTSSQQAIAERYLFKNPNPGEGEAYILDLVN